MNGHRTRSFGLAWALFFLTAAAPFLAGSESLGFAKRANWVTAAPVSPVRLSGHPARVEMVFRVAPGFHINSNRPKDDLLEPTALRISPPTDILVGKIDYPEGRDVDLSFSPGEKLNVYTGDFSIRALITASSAIMPGTYRVHAVLKYQACDNRQCYPAKNVPVDFDVKVSRPGHPSQSANPGQSPHIHR